MKKLGLGVLAVFFLGVMTAQELTMEEVYKGIEFDMPKVAEPQFPDYSVNIIDFGAEHGGLIKNTKAITAAIGDVHDNGGGKVIIPRGIWLTGPIELKSNINLHLKSGALLLFSRDFDDYKLVETSFEGLNTIRNQSPISAREVENVAITGKGTIDGNGDAWRPVKKGKMTSSQWNTLVKSGGVLSDDGKMWFPSEKSKLGYNSSSNFNVPDLIDQEQLATVKDFLRPVMVSILNSKTVLLDGPTFQNSPAWNIHPLMSENIIIRNLDVKNPWYSQNGDGLDLESCKNVLIYNNTFDVGDDAICFKSGKNQDGRDRGMPTENVIVKNNIVYHGHGGFVIGSEMSGGVKNVHVSKCTFIGTDVGLRFKSTRGRGGIVENIYISDIDMINIPTETIRFNMFYGGNSPVLEEDQSAEDEARDEQPQPVTEETPSFKNISIKNIRAIASKKAVFFMGLPEMNLKNVSLENAVFQTQEGITAIDADGLTLTNVKVISEDEALTFYNSKNVTVKGLSFGETNGAAVRVLGSGSKNLNFSKNDFTDIENQVIQSKGVLKSAVKIK